MQWLAEHPRPTESQALHVSIEILKAAVPLGQPRLKAIAIDLYERLLTFLRDLPATTPPSSDRHRLEEWTAFIKKHYGLVYTFSEKRTNLEYLIDVNKNRPTPDALIYAARLRLQGMDVKWEHRIDAPVLAIAPLGIDGKERFGMTRANGAVEVLDIDSLREPEVLLKPTELPEGDPETPFRNYSRVLYYSAKHQRWFTAFRKRWIDLRPVEDRSKHQIAVHWPDDIRRPQVYSVYHLDEDRLLLGVRDLDEPLAVYDFRDHSLTDVGATWGTSRHVQTAFVGGERRVWVIRSLDPDDRDVVAVAAEDGYLRFGRIKPPASVARAADDSAGAPMTHVPTGQNTGLSSSKPAASTRVRACVRLSPVGTMEDECSSRGRSWEKSSASCMS